VVVEGSQHDVLQLIDGMQQRCLSRPLNFLMGLDSVPCARHRTAASASLASPRFSMTRPRGLVMRPAQPAAKERAMTAGNRAWIFTHWHFLKNKSVALLHQGYRT
jgi:hypothetical protein